ncbi:MAG TPA: multifunctional CCA addition/repair protein [Gammaproteobacteria bacterium]|nr:multifunctional CCA addition/repair protein [Gammaproteobacteria bacterium]
MNVYQVGGSVRDQLLGLPVKDRDWVVVGATPEDLLALGYKQVGKDFPVFLHPDTHEEYALARTERKTAPGYHGFTVHAAPDVTLKEDLRRRDLTINALALTPDGTLVDPFGGARDLKERWLRHVSPAFAEDPVRILRLARFSARFAPLGFRVAAETLALMRDMVAAGEVDALVPERVWQETVGALGEAQPARFFQMLRACGALARVFPELDRLFGVPQPRQHHPEIDVGVHTLSVLTQAAARSASPRVRFAALLHDLGKGLTPAAQWPRHLGHEARGLAAVKAVCARLKVPREYRALALLVGEFHGHSHRALELRPASVVKLLERLDAFRRPERFEEFLLACRADAAGRPGFAERPYPQMSFLHRAWSAARAVDPRSLLAAGWQGAALAGRLRAARRAAIAALSAPP